MTTNDLDDEIDQLAVRIEESIESGQRFLDGLPDFAPRSERSLKMQNKIEREA